MKMPLNSNFVINVEKAARAHSWRPLWTPGSILPKRFHTYLTVNWQRSKKMHYTSDWQRFPTMKHLLMLFSGLWLLNTNTSTGDSSQAEGCGTEVDHDRLLFLAHFTHPQAQNIFTGSITCHLLNLSNWKWQLLFMAFPAESKFGSRLLASVNSYCISRFLLHFKWAAAKMTPMFFFAMNVHLH